MMLLVILLVAAALLLFREIYERQWSHGVEVRLNVEEPFVYAGETAHFTEIVANRGRIPLPEIEVRFRFPQGPVFQDAENVILSDHLYKRDVFALRPMEQITRRYILTCPRRGCYPVSDLTVRAKSFWHGRNYEISQNTAAQLNVYAAWTDVWGILAHCDAILGSLESRRRTFEDPFAWASIRAYTPQDPMRSVNWKASARTGELMVNTYASVQAAQFCIFLDVVEERIICEDDLLELGISAAASLSRRLIGRGQESGLYVYSDVSATPEVSMAGVSATPEVLGKAGRRTTPEVSGRRATPEVSGRWATPEVSGRSATPEVASQSLGAQIPPSRGQSQLTKIEQALADDLTGYLKRKAGQSSGPENRTAKVELPGFAKWAIQASESNAAERICVFISKEEECLQELEQLWRKAGYEHSARQSAPAILVQPTYEDGISKLKSRIIE